MDTLVQCPVCTLFLHNGMSLESHLDTHPKDQVIKALCSFASKNSSNYGSRTPTPLHSERSYRSRSRTPATDDSGKWNSSSRHADHDRYWRRTPSRTPKPSSRNCTPDVRPHSISGNIGFDSSSGSSSSTQISNPLYSMKADKMQQTYQTLDTDFDQQCMYFHEQQEDREIKYSRSAEYNAMDGGNNMFAYNVPTTGPGVKLQSPSLPGPLPKRGTDLVKILPKPNNILLKTNVGGVQYMAPSGKPMHVVMPTAPAFLQKNIQNNMLITTGMPSAQVQIETKTVPPLMPNQFNQLTSGSFSPGTTVVTQNSQIIYREMVHSVDGKPFISAIPPVLTGHENVAQGSSVYQNVMVVDQFGNTSCMYTPPQTLLSKTYPTTIYTDTGALLNNTYIDKTVPNMNDPNKTLIIEVGPIVPPEPITSCIEANSVSVTQPEPVTATASTQASSTDDRNDPKNDMQSATKGLKILSNIKVEVPVQHHKNMINTIMDLTGPNDTVIQEYPNPSISPERILPDIEVKEVTMENAGCQTPLENEMTFAAIKNMGNSSRKLSPVDNKLDTEYGDSCPVPDLICNEKPSISPCSELSDHGDNSIDHTISTLPKLDCIQNHKSVDTKEKNVQTPPKPHRNTLLRLNNIYVKKNKKILQIKNSKSSTMLKMNPLSTETEPIPSSSTCKSPHMFNINKSSQSGLGNAIEKSTLQTVSVEEIKDNEFGADTGEPMDIEQVAPSSVNSSTDFETNVDVVQVKEEINTSNEGGFSNETITSANNLTTLEALRPINVANYGSMPGGDFNDDSNQGELLQLEAASKNKHFVSMMNDNYFGDNMYADYFNPDRMDSFDDRESSSLREGNKDGLYGCGIWGESSHRESEFVLPNFIHESYKIAESNGIDYAEVEGKEGRVDGEEEACERDSKADVLSESRSEEEPPMNICADERMPPRGELSGQESNGDMESTWPGMYTDVPPAETYDLMARESWVSDGSELDTTEKRDTLEEEIQVPKVRLQTCSICGAKFPTLKELRSHRANTHAQTPNTYSRMLIARSIKKEEKPDVRLTTSPFPPIDSKESITSTILEVYDTIDETKPKLEGLIKQEPKRKRRDYVCPTCKVDQGSDVAFLAHLKIHPLECLTCGKLFYRRSNMALHLRTHLGIKNYKCDICEKRFMTRQKLLEHQNVHTGRAPVKCTLCDDTFRRYSNMVQHRNRHHYQKRGKSRDWVCQCGAVFGSRARLAWHRETHDERPKACLYCSDKFVHAASLTRHVRRTHNEYYIAQKMRGKQENVTCHVCKQVYLRTNLRAHLLTHSGKRPYPCVVCNKSFTTKWNLKLHKWTHMNRSAKPYKCSLCKGAFIRHTEYISHMNSHKSVRPYTCNYCGCQFIRKYNCQRHVREHEMAKKFVCKVPECGKSFHRSYYLSEHMKVHSGARPFSCNICGKTSSNKSNHNKHVKIHHAREPVATEA